MNVHVYPGETFVSESKLAKILGHLGCGTSTAKPANLTVWHSDKPCDLIRKSVVVNRRDFMLDKHLLGLVFKMVFGYPISVQPEDHFGYVVRKIAGHEKHGEVVQCPRNRDSMVYQRLITNHPDKSWVEEWRVDIYGSELLVTRKEIEKNRFGFPIKERKPFAFQFDVPVTDAFSSPEIELIQKLNRGLVLEYGSLDAIRDLDGRLYIIDATTETSCPNPVWHANCTGSQYIAKSAACFEDAFLS